VIRTGTGVASTVRPNAISALTKPEITVAASRL
jgi:hypothetical protein